jgi:hypothetical protein
MYQFKWSLCMKNAVLVLVWCFKSPGHREQSLWRYWQTGGCNKKWYDLPTGCGCLSKKCWLGSNKAVTLLYLVTWPSTLTYRVKTQDSKLYDSHHWPESPLMYQIALCFVYCFLDLWTFCEAVLLLTYIVATKIWSCCELDPWHIIHILGFITPNFLLSVL